MMSTIFGSTSNILLAVVVFAHLVANAVALLHYIVDRTMDKNAHKSGINVRPPQGMEFAGELLKTATYGWLRSVGLTAWVYTMWVKYAISKGWREDKRRGMPHTEAGKERRQQGAQKTSQARTLPVRR